MGIDLDSRILISVSLNHADHFDSHAHPTYRPDSPRFFIMKGKKEKARASLARLRDQPVDSDLITREVQNLTEAYEEDAKISSTSWKDCFTGGFKRGSNLRRTLVGTIVQMMQQLSKYFSYSHV